MKRSLIFGTGFGLFLMVASAGANTLDPTNYNFPLGGGGGGAQATLNGVSVEIFCDNFANEISLGDDYSADITSLSTTANLDETRFGGVASNAWTTIVLTSGSSQAEDDTFFNSGAGSGALARYEMAAYLVSQYDVSQGNTKSNERIQEAIWTLLDPKAEGAAVNPDGVNPSIQLEDAASWYKTMNTGNLNALNAFLADYEIVSDPKMKFTNGLGVGGFQEQIVDPVHLTATPEPRGGIWMLIGLLGVAAFPLRRARRMRFGRAA
jgi:hypothetical protein